MSLVNEPLDSSAIESKQILTYPQPRNAPVTHVRHDFAGWSPSANALRRIAARRSTYFCRIEPSGVAGVLLALLMLYMGPASISHYGHPKVVGDLPFAEHRHPLHGAIREDAMNLRIARGGKVGFGFVQIARSEIPVQIRESLASGSEPRVYLWADRRAKYSDIREALDLVRQAGVTNISIVTTTVPPSPNFTN